MEKNYMKKAYVLLFIVIILFSCTKNNKNNDFRNLSMEEKTFIQSQINFMDKIIEMYNEIKYIHISLEELYPITIIHNNNFFVFDLDDNGNKYELKLKMELPEFMSGDFSYLLAAFPLDFYEMKASVVISNNILENPDNHIAIFHEFVHCFQWHNGELDIRRELLVEKQECEKNNFNWELDYPFPYNSEYFINKTIELSNSITYENMLQYHMDMKKYLQETEFEYMIWQEWKEGFARYVENLIRIKLEMEINTNELNPPFNRVHFYEIGSKYIKLFVNNENELGNNIKELFYRMKIN